MASASTCVSSSSSKASNSSSCSTNKKEEGTTSSSSTKPVNPPEIVKYAYKEFVVDRAENKWKAKCCACRDFITCCTLVQANVVMTGTVPYGHTPLRTPSLSETP